MKINRTTLRDRCRLAAAGVDKHLASELAIPVGDGETKSAADLKAALQNTINAADATQVARTRWIDASRTEKDLGDATRLMLAALKSFVLLRFGTKDGSTLADFGFSAPKQAQVPLDTKVAAAEKRAGTRAARHTMGKNQKKSVKGTVEVPVGTVPATATTTAPAAPAATPAVAAPAPVVTATTTPRAS